MRRKSEPKGGFSPKTTHPPLFLLLVKISDKSNPPPFQFASDAEGKQTSLTLWLPSGNKFCIDTCIAIPNLNKSLLLLYLVDHSYADYCLTYYSNNINTYYMYCADGCCGYSHDRKCCTKIKYDFSASNYNL